MCLTFMCVMFVFIADTFIIITYLDRYSLYCSSPNLVTSIYEVTPFCVISGNLYSYNFKDNSNTVDNNERIQLRKHAIKQ